MLNKLQLPNETIAIRTQDKVMETLVDIYVVGKQKVDFQDYYWNGLKRQERDVFIFQYTLSGEGAIHVHGKTYKLQKGQAFMVEVPSDHYYYIPEESEEWEFIFLTLKGQAAASCWNYIMEQFGNVVTIPMESQLINQVFNIYQQAYDRDLLDNYYASSQAYGFIMDCYRYFKQFKTDSDLPEKIVLATNMIKKRYKEPLSVEEIADAVQLSKYYFIKLFRENMNMTPMQYVTKIRLEQALHLLRYTDSTVKEIAKLVGYSDDNYFNKVFRKVVGISPGEFRKNKHSLPFDRLVIQ
ncbi:AraC-like DNA-binding protein [Evansella vedderi]|uniref:AraC-like DNA-binding protein n=1 Tax=Evansella vedderi TaxID=38282 RepID=A0ABT9ZYV9_9BACI|nr:AraC family transcriptional regulator [Evansella vedderi]MDQ0255927.1 AraC-like DNA-binding protein [Evansella vedderi]